MNLKYLFFCAKFEGKSKEESNPVKWKWVAVKQSGCRPSPRCSSSMVVTGQNRALLFGGVFDEVCFKLCICS